MALIRTLTRVFTKQEKDRAKTMIDNLVSPESNVQDDDLTRFVKHIMRINELIQGVVWVGGLYIDHRKEIYGFTICTIRDFQKKNVPNSASTPHIGIRT